jgi:hypothetical protein
MNTPRQIKITNQCDGCEVYSCPSKDKSQGCPAIEIVNGKLVFLEKMTTRQG